MAQPDLNELARRPVRYWNADGVPELVLGLMWIVWGGAWLIGQTIPYGWRSGLYWLTVPPALALSAFATKPLIRRVKARITFPRTGYVEWKQPEASSRVAAAAVIVVAALALAVVIVNEAGDRSLEHRLPPIMTVVLSVSFLALSIRHRAPHYLAFAAVAIAVSLATASLVSGWDSLSWMFVALGAACTFFGGVKLALFVRAHQVVPTEGL